MLLERLGVRARVVNDGPVPSSLRFLPGIERAATFPDGLAEPADLLVTVDCGARELLFGVAEKLRDVPIANVDHHVGNAGYGRWNWIEPRAAAVGEMIYDLVEACGVVPDAAMATNIYVSLVTDTGRFSFSNTTPRTHEIAARLLRAGVKPDLVSREVYRSRTPGQLALLARTIASLSVHAGGRVATARLTQAMCRECGAAPWDTQEFVDVPKSVRGAEVGLLLRELGDGSIKVSLRSEGGVDVDALARRFGGGGHVRASGCTLPPPLSEAERRVLAAAEQALDGAGKSLTSPPVIH